MKSGRRKERKERCGWHAYSVDQSISLALKHIIWQTRHAGLRRIGLLRLEETSIGNG